MKKLYEKSEIYFAILWIIIYVIGMSLCNTLSKFIGLENLANALFSILLSAFLFIWLLKNGLLKKYGLCKPSIPASKFLWYIPLILIASYNLWGEVVVTMTPLVLTFSLCMMLCVGFLEEIIFRGFLFTAMSKDNIKVAIIVSSVTFGLGHIVNLFNGSDMAWRDNVFQIFSAILFGFLLVIMFYRGKSILPCIALHSIFNALSIFNNEEGVSNEKLIFMRILLVCLLITYTVFLLKRLPKPQE